MTDKDRRLILLMNFLRQKRMISEFSAYERSQIPRKPRAGSVAMRAYEKREAVIRRKVSDYIRPGVSAKSRSLRMRMQKYIGGRIDKLTSGDQKPAVYKLTYTSKAKDTKGRRWREYHISGQPHGRRVQLKMSVTFHYTNRTYGTFIGASAARKYTDPQVLRLMADEAFSSAVSKTRMSYGMIRGYRVNKSWLVAWTEKPIR